MTRSGWTSANSGPDYRAGDDKPVTIAGFLSARLDEDVANVHTTATEHYPHYVHQRILREVAAKRAIIAEHDPDGHYCVTQAGAQWTEPGQPCSTLRALLSVYSDHPDYDEAWRP